MCGVPAFGHPVGLCCGHRSLRSSGFVGRADTATPTRHPTTADSYQQLSTNRIKQRARRSTTTRTRTRLTIAQRHCDREPGRDPSDSAQSATMLGPNKRPQRAHLSHSSANGQVAPSATTNPFGPSTLAFAGAQPAAAAAAHPSTPNYLQQQYAAARTSNFADIAPALAARRPQSTKKKCMTAIRARFGE